MLTASPWAASPVVSSEEAAQAAAVLDDVRRHTLPRTLALLQRAAGETGFPAPAAVAGWTALIAAWAEAGAVLSAMTPAVYDLNLQDACEALAPAGRGGFSRLWAALTSSRYKAARAGLRAAVTEGRKLGDRDLYASAVAARDGARNWAGLGGRGIPCPPGSLPECRASHEHLTAQLGQLQAWSGQPGLAERPAGECERLLGMLDADRRTLARLPELHRLRTVLEAAGLGEFITMMTARQASEDFAVSGFWYAWLASVLDHLELTDLAVGSFSADSQQAAVGDSRQRRPAPHRDDAGRVRRVYGENVVRARDAVQGPGGARPASGRAEAAAPAGARLRAQRARRAAGPQALLGDEPAGGQPAAAAAALLRRGHLRRGVPDHPGRRGDLDPARQAAGRRRRRQAAAPDRVVRLRQRR